VPYPGDGAVFFDLDGTMVPGSSLFPLAREMRRRGLIRIRDLARVGADQAWFRWGRMERPDLVDRARAMTLAAVRGRSRAAMLAVARAVVQDEVLPRVYPRAIELIRIHRLAGRAVYLATSSPQDYAAIIADELGIDGAIGTLAEVRAGRYTGRLDGPLNHGLQKAARVTAFAKDHGIDLSRSVAFSDSVNDLPMLHAVGEPVAVNADRTLLIVARRMGWPVLDLRSGVVRPRVRRPSVA
jgi:HAD superfamily hydrolase (TIGR01490 family)